MDTILQHVYEWSHLLIRWSHFLAGIMWIGTSLYFVWLDSSFEPPASSDGKQTGLSGKGKVEGDVWMVHGGNFYHVEKRKFGPGEMPKNLHWFKWEATLTWLSGFLLLIVVYYLSNGMYLIDSARNPLGLTSVNSSILGLAVVFGGWFVYDALYRLQIKMLIKNVIALSLLVALSYALSQVMSGRGFFMHMGAMLGTCMILNVWRHILPNQQAIIDASEKGQNPNYDLGIKAKTRSMHNSYMTLPVLFVMISNHFGSLFGHSMNWLVLLLMILLGATIRHGMIIGRWWPAVPASGLLAVLFAMTYTQGPGLGLAHSTSGALATVLDSQAQHIIEMRCQACHSANPTDEVFKVAPNGVMFENLEDIKKYKGRILQRAIIQKTMPLQNKTQMTDLERDILRLWIEESHGQ